MEQITLIEVNWKVGCKVGDFSEEVNSVVLEVNDKTFEVIMKENIEKSRIAMNFIYEKYRILNIIWNDK